MSVSKEYLDAQKAGCQSPPPKVRTITFSSSNTAFHKPTKAAAVNQYKPNLPKIEIDNIQLVENVNLLHLRKAREAIQAKATAAGFSHNYLQPPTKNN